MVSDPIKQLENFLDDPGKVFEKISSIHSALESIKIHLPRTSGLEGAFPNLGPADLTAATILDDPVYGRLLQGLRDMQTQIEERIRPVAQEIMQYEVARLRDQTDQQQIALRECLEQIDQCILTCLSRMDEYQRRCADLENLNHRLTDLGAAPEPVPPPLATGSAVDGILARLEGLRAEGKI
jgi:hypothetical protein